ncbi:hypothetical protein PZB75_00195 [Streptomyces sp. AM 4-1-1]|uniref:hypothetical protein n=1 Tax=Streptomyces sp. AM 4-1-1 TaxID=3028710 RepID=UPI0023BA18E3|nr:hypothetical protein [Streptomyces sp. AM 4-1-1]WEH31940.1 hypothetical protein PZB75_00195 [Streptomyces sp. AM 4-1-1]
MWNLRLRQQRAGTEQRPAVLEPGAWGQIPLFTIPRTLTADTARAVAGRPVPGWEKAQAVLEEIAAEQGLSRGNRYRKAALLRLALAIRAAEGTWLLPEVLLRDLPAGRNTIRLVLQRAGLLASEPEPCDCSQQSAAHPGPWPAGCPGAGRRIRVRTARRGCPLASTVPAALPVSTGTPSWRGAPAHAATGGNSRCGRAAAAAAARTVSSTTPSPPPPGTHS